MQLLRGRTTNICSLAISPDSRYVVAGSEFIIHCWDMANPKCKPWPIAEGRGHVYRMQFTSEAMLFAKFKDRWFQYDLTASTASIYKLPRRVGPGLSSSILHPNGLLLKVLCQGRTVENFRVTDAGFERTGRAMPVAYFHRLLNTNPSGDRYLAVARLVGGGSYDTHLFDTATDGFITSLESPCLFDLSSQSCVFSPNGRNIYAADNNKLLAFDCAVGGPPVVMCHIHRQVYCSALAIHPDGRILATIENKREVTFRDAATLQVTRTYDFAMPKLTCVAFTPDGTRCVVGNSRGKVLLFDVE